MMKSVWLLLLALPLGCGGDNHDHPTPAPPPVDAPGSDAPPDAPPPPPKTAPPDTVIGTVLTHCPTPTGSVSEPADLTLDTIQALIPDPTAPTGFRTEIGVGRADGTFEIDHVPDGARYTLQIESQFYVTDQHVIDGGFDDEFRCAPVPVFAGDATSVALHLDHMSPFGIPFEDRVTVTSFAIFSQVDAGDTPQPGDTSIVSTFPWSNFLPDGKLGDDFTVLHLHQDSKHDDLGVTRSSERIVDAFLRRDVTVKDGTTTTVTGSFTPAPSTPPVTVAFDLAPYAAPYQATSSLNSVEARLEAAPYRDHAFGGAAIGRFSMFGGDLANTPMQGEIPAADPFPASWHRMLTIDPSESRFFRLSDVRVIGLGTGPEQELVYTTTPPTVIPAPMAPPTALEVNGHDADPSGTIASDGHAPITVQWQAAPEATHYELQIWNLKLNAPSTGNPFDVIRVIADFDTADTSVTIPASVLTDNAFYAFVVLSSNDHAGFATGHLFGTSSQRTRIASGRWRFSSTCGNGTIDPGEDCDDGGESATCNADCTVASCGDGVVNATAGEACDTVSPTAACDSSTCLAPSPTARGVVRTAPPAHFLRADGNGLRPHLTVH